MTKLSDTQAVLLSGAAQRADGSLLPLPASIAGGTRVAKALAGLLTRGLAEERAAGSAEAVYRENGDRRLGLFITAAGQAAIGVGEGEPQDAPEPDTATAAADAHSPAPAPAPAPAQAGPRQTKAMLVLGLLTREGGATLPELIAATGWLPHTTRAALTGLRRKGHGVQRGKRGDVTCYSVAGTGPDLAGAR